MLMIRKGDGQNDSAAKSRSGYCENPGCEHRIYVAMGRNVSWIIFAFIVAGICSMGLYLDDRGSKKVDNGLDIVRAELQVYRVTTDKRMDAFEGAMRIANEQTMARQTAIMEGIKGIHTNTVVKQIVPARGEYIYKSTPMPVPHDAIDRTTKGNK
jgi:hypothetical protein